jgi:anti-repressor protein
MESLIRVNYGSERPTTSARELWEFLDKPYTKFTMWFDKYKEYSFNENEDYVRGSVKTYTPEGGTQEATDYEITVDMAKELAMLQKSEKGSIARKFFIELEKQWNSPEALMARALKMADQKIHHLSSIIEKDKPKVLFADSVSTSKTSILIGELAKIIKQNGIEIGEKRLFEWLRQNGYLISRFGTDHNDPTQRAMELKLFELKETVINHSSGFTTISKTTKVTGKGQQYFINKFLGEILS